MESNAGMFKFFFAPEIFNKHNRVLVVAANHDTVLDTKDAPSDMKNVVLGFDSLVSQLQYDLDHRNMDMPLDDEYALKEQAQSFLKDCINEEIDYYDYYKNKYKLS